MRHSGPATGRGRDGIAVMPEDLRSQNRWRYWAARAAEQLGDKVAAKQGYTDVLPTDNWYAVLSAARLGQPFVPTLVPMGLNDREMAALATQPAFVRARNETLRPGDAGNRPEWRAAYTSLAQPQQVQAIGLAARWGWYLQAIAGGSEAQDLRRLRPALSATLRSRGAQGLDAIGTATDLIYAIIRQESLYRADARSSAGALGLMQLLPETADERRRRGTCRCRSTSSLLRALGERAARFGVPARPLRPQRGQASLAIGSYNAGPGAVRRWLPESPMAMDVWVENIPYNETRGYVQSVSWHMIVFGWLAERKARDVSGWLGVIRAPNAGDTSTRELNG